MITPRLKCIIDHVSGCVIADIGTDHAYIPIYLLQNNMAERVIASDIRRGPAKIACANAEKNNLSDKIEVKLGCGLSVLKKGEADTIIIAGMGGQLICEILAADMETARAGKLVLQPMNAQYELRRFLLEHGFCITDEDLAVEGFKVYNILTAESGKQEPFKNDIEYHIPKYLKNHKYYKQLYEKKRREFMKVINGLKRSKNLDAEKSAKLEKYEFWLRELKKYESE